MDGCIMVRRPANGLDRVSLPFYSKFSKGIVISNPFDSMTLIIT